MGTQSTLIDITGQKFGELTVLKYVGDRKWLCQCSCGKQKIVRKNDLTSGKVKSCGHLSNRGNGVKVGEKYGEWTVLEKEAGNKYKCQCSCGKIGLVGGYDLKYGKSKSCGHLTKGTGINGRKYLTGTKIGEWSVGKYLGDGYYECTCSCGTVKNLKGTYLRTGQSTSCGHATNAFKDLSGQRFGEWTVIKYIGDYKYKCRCSCGKEGIVSRWDLITGKSTNCGHKRAPNLEGQRFGKLIVNKYLGHNLWECTCDCGNKTTAFTSNLLIGNKVSCGCLLEENKQKNIQAIDSAINNYTFEHKIKPFYEDIAQLVNLNEVTIRHYVKSQHWEFRFNTKFGSKYEKEIYEILKKHNNNIIVHDRTILGGQELDLYLPDAKIAIEFNGDYWHNVDMLGEKYHQNKAIECEKLGIRLISIFEHEWISEEKRNKIENLLNEINSTEIKRIYARNTYISNIDRKTAIDFLEKYHIDGYAEANILLGCFEKDTKELLGVTTYGKPRFNSNYQYELIRMCWKFGISVVGGFSKLFRYFIYNFDVESVLSYVDFSKFNGNSYLKAGFKFDGITVPNYVWVKNGHLTTVLSRYQTMKSSLIAKGWGTESNTEDEMMIGHGFIKIYNCGNKKYTYRKD